MSGGVVVVPCRRDEGFVALSRSPRGRLFKKQILHVGEEFVHPGNPGRMIRVDGEFVAALSRNFKGGLCDIVQVPIVDGENRHVEDPLRNIGEVVDLVSDDKGVYAVIDARKAEYAAELGNTLLGASAMLHLDYTDKRTGRKVGPTLLHVAITNRPYITNLGGFEEILAASADTYGEPTLLERRKSGGAGMDLDDMLQELKSRHGIDVEDMQARLSEYESAEAPETFRAEFVAALSEVLQESDVLALSDAGAGSVSLSDIAEAVVQLSQTNAGLKESVVSLAAQVDVLEREKVEARVEFLVRNGFIIPAKRDVMMKLALSDPELFEQMIPESPIVALSETGAAFLQEPDSQIRDGLEAEVDRLLANLK